MASRYNFMSKVFGFYIRSLAKNNGTDSISTLFIHLIYTITGDRLQGRNTMSQYGLEYVPSSAQTLLYNAFCVSVQKHGHLRLYLFRWVSISTYSILENRKKSQAAKSWEKGKPFNDFEVLNFTI